MLRNDVNQYVDYTPLRNRMYLLLTILLLVTALSVFLIARRSGGDRVLYQKLEADRDLLILKDTTLNRKISAIYDLMKELAPNEDNHSRFNDSIQATLLYIEQLKNYKVDTILSPIASLLHNSYKMDIEKLEYTYSIWIKQKLTPGVPADCSNYIADIRSLNTKINGINNSWNTWWKRNSVGKPVKEVSIKFDNKGWVESFQVRKSGGLLDGRASNDHNIFKNLGMKFK